MFPLRRVVGVVVAVDAGVDDGDILSVLWIPGPNILHESGRSYRPNFS